MSLQTRLLETHLAQAVLMAQRSASRSQTAATFDLPAGLVMDLQRALRQFGALRQERNTIEAVLAAAPAEQRGQLLLRRGAFDADLARLLERAARLAFLWMASQRRGGNAARLDAAQRVQYLGTVFGHPLDAARVRHSVQRFAATPVGAANEVDPETLAEAAFIALALVLALAAAAPGSA
jgi:hypothetical protein